MSASRCQEVLQTFEAHELSAELTLMELLIETEDAAQVEALVLGHRGERAPLLAATFAAQREGCERVANILRNEQPQHAQAPSVEEGLAATRALFDGLVVQSEEASVALYSLGSAQILHRATAEIVALLARWELLSPTTRVLDFGCGIGRIAQAIAPEVARVDAIDISPEMVATATRRTSAVHNVRVSLANGRALQFGDDSFELVLAVDSFPYVVQAGGSLAEQLFAEVARVLIPGGTFVLLNYSYRGDLTRDGEEVATLATNVGLRVVSSGERPFRLWNGAAFRLLCGRD
jgi:SAM-dependent methyltransferase